MLSLVYESEVYEFRPLHETVLRNKRRNQSARTRLIPAEIQENSITSREQAAYSRIVNES
jgi:hypothetical protein